MSQLSPRSRPKEARCPAVTFQGVRRRVLLPLGYHSNSQGSMRIHGPPRVP